MQMDGGIACNVAARTQDTWRTFLGNQHLDRMTTCSCPDGAWEVVSSQQFGERLLVHVANGRLHVSTSASSRDWGTVAMTLLERLLVHVKEYDANGWRDCVQ